MKRITFKRGQGHWKVIYQGAEVGAFHDQTKAQQHARGWTFCGVDGYTGRGKTRLKAIENCMQERKRLFSMADIKELNREAGQYFFSRDTMRFFKSTIVTGLLKGGYFITGESQSGYGSGRKYTARKVDYLNGSIQTLGEFGKCSTRALAKLNINLDRAA